MHIKIALRPRAHFVTTMSLRPILFALASASAAPIVGVSLAPAEPPSALSEAIAGLDSSREALESQAAGADVGAFNAALRAAKPRIDAIAKEIAGQLLAPTLQSQELSSVSFVSKANSHRTSNANVETIDVDVVAAAPVDVASAVAAAKGLESKWSAEEISEFSRRLADFDALTDVVISGTRRAAQVMLASHDRQAAASFVDISSVAAGPAAAAIVGMEARRDVSERFGQAKHLALVMALYRRENEMLRDAIRREVSTAHATGVAFLEMLSGQGRRIIDLQPPQEDERVVSAAIDAIMSSEKQKAKAANAFLANEKQRALDAGKAEVQGIVRHMAG